MSPAPSLYSYLPTKMYYAYLLNSQKRSQNSLNKEIVLNKGEGAG